ncbi:hypothetical protein [Celeribacter indicus]|uniref:Uncharacterized protein n=1 Tax=Celeribacter indicus TaxID=1208324 RepID=A0A0B5E071_9RHOB|nr:hypothetical protein [Celeribacter indicus]AJE48644.1 hypothetical protein P73_3929 [Celeribacter indicus]SDX34804.1 hypothetical protein SAMN05443573_1238 [Celeribacter indicus]
MKLHHLAASAIAIMAAVPAVAFDTITWNWDADVQTTIATDALSSVSVAPTGLEQVESDQTTLGAFTATSSSTAIDNALTGLTGLSTDDVVNVETQASALGNSASFDSDVSMALDARQVFGGVDTSLSTSLTGEIVPSVPGVITASASTIGILNGTVDSDATGVANNLTAALTTASAQDAFLLANNVQTALATVTSTSSVDAVSFTGIGGLGTLSAPAVSSASTAVGNNLGVTIDGPN